MLNSRKCLDMLDAHYYNVDDELVEKCRWLDLRLCKLSENGRLAHTANSIRGWLLNDLSNLGGCNELADKHSADEAESKKWKDMAAQVLARIKDHHIVLKFINCINSL